MNIISKYFHFLFTNFKINSFLLFEKGGISLCLWGFLCPVCLFEQEMTYSELWDDYTQDDSLSLTESQTERFPPWSCRSLDRFELMTTLFLGCCCCLFGTAVGYERHQQYHGRHNFEYYCSSQPCCCCNSFLIEDCLIGQFCCCCSLIQLTMVNDERFRMNSKVEGGVNIKRAL